MGRTCYVRILKATPHIDQCRTPGSMGRWLGKGEMRHSKSLVLDGQGRNGACRAVARGRLWRQCWTVTSRGILRGR